MDWLVGQLSRPARIRDQVLLYFFCSRTYLGAKRHHDRTHGGAMHPAAAARESTTSERGATRIARKEPQSTMANDSNQSETTNELGRRVALAWRRFPSCGRAGALYECLVSAYLCLVVVKNALPLLLARPIEWLQWLASVAGGPQQAGSQRTDALPAHCYLVGRFFIHPSYGNEPIAASLCLVLLCWRLAQLLLLRPFSMTFADFLVQDEPVLEQYYKLTQLDETNNNNNNNRCQSRSESSRPHSHNNNNNNSWPPSRTATRNSNSNSVARAAASECQPGSDSSSGSWRHLECLHRTMSFRCLLSERFRYQLRPNRSLAAKRQLTRLTALVSGLCLVGWLLLLAGFLIYATSYLVTDAIYLTRYPGCDPQLERQLRADMGLTRRRHHPGALESTRRRAGSPVWSWHRLVAFGFDLAENLLLWGEFHSAMLTTLALGYLLNHDLIVYWRTIDQRAHQIVATLRLWHRRLEASLFAELEARHHHHHHHHHERLMPSYHWTPPPPAAAAATLSESISSCPSSIRYRGLFPASPQLQLHFELLDSLEKSHLDRRTLELQAQLLDFFQQFKQVDLYMSDALTGSYVIWLSSVVIFGFLGTDYYLTYHQYDLTLVFALIQALAFVCLSLMSLHLLALRRQCLATHKRLCSIMALDGWSNYRLEYRKLLDLYTIRSGFSYTLFGQLPFTPVAFISIIGWSISCFIVIDNVYLRHQRA